MEMCKEQFEPYNIAEYLKPTDDDLMIALLGDALKANNIEHFLQLANTIADIKAKPFLESN